MKSSRRAGPSSASMGPSTSSVVPSKDRFYAVFIPPEDAAKSNETDCVAKGLHMVLQILKRNPNLRFQSAETEEAALDLIKHPTSVAYDIPEIDIYSENGPDFRPEELVDVTPIEIPTPDPKKKKRNRQSMPSSFDSKNAVVLVSNNTMFVGEYKDTRFPTPKTQELTALAREISQFKNSTVIERVSANPKLLISDCDRPTTVQEGCRYNALHIAAKCDNYEMVTFILSSVSSYKYIQNLFPKCRREIIIDRIKYITDAYLNTPDKMTNETPLHFATKFLCVNAVRVLVRHPWTNTMATNLQRETAYEIIGSRCVRTDPDFKSKCREISELLQAVFIVPVWRDAEALLNPLLGEVSHIRQLGKKLPLPIISCYVDFDVEYLADCEYHLYPKKSSGKNFGAIFEVIDEWRIKAFAGPMKKAKAVEFLNILKSTCARGPGPSDCLSPTLFLNSPPPSISLTMSTQTPPEIETSHFRTPYRTPPTPSSPYPTSPKRNQSHLMSPTPTSPGPKDIIIRRKDPEKGYERMGRKFALQNHIPWEENWDFLDFYGDISSDNGLKILEEQLLNAETTEKALELQRGKIMKDECVGGRGDADDNKPECDSDGESQCSWHSAASSITDNEDREFEDCVDDQIFFFGRKPSKEDFQVFIAMKDREDVVSEKYPMVAQWFNTMKTLDEYDDYDNPRSYGPVSGACRNARLRLRDLKHIQNSLGRLDFSDV